MMEYKKWEKGLLRPDGLPGFDTPSGKFEIASSILEEHGYDALPVYTEPGEGPLAQPELARRFPLVFNSGARSNVDLHALHQSLPSLSREKPVPTVMMTPRDAAPRGIQNGDPVRLTTLRGSISLYAQVTEDIVAGAVEANAMGGGALGPQAWREACVNDLTDLGRYDPISGFPVYKALLCEVTKAAEGAAVTIAGPGEYTPDGSVESAAPHRRIYLDHNATTPMDPEVQKTVIASLECYGNPSSLYAAGQESRTAVEAARRSIALLLNCTARRVVFTGGGSEANNLAVKGAARANGRTRDHIITSVIEHPSVLQPCRGLERQGFRGESLVLALDQRGVAVSSGSACRAGAPEPSQVLLALGLSEEEAHCALRFSLGRETTGEEIERTLSILGDILRNQQPVVRFVSCR